MPPFIEAVIERVRAWFAPLPVSDGPPPWGAGVSNPFLTDDTTPPWVTPAAEAAVEKKVPAAQPVQERSVGEFYFREAILDQLDFYFLVLRRMRHSDHDAYSLYRQIGAHIIPRTQFKWENATAVSPWWKLNRPTFGAVGYAFNPAIHKVEEAEKKMLPRFLYFTKFAPAMAPPHLQRVNSGDVYTLTVYWDLPKKNEWKRGAPTEYGLHVSPEGEVRVLRSLCHERTRIKEKRGLGHFSIPQQRWGIEKFFLDWAREHKTDPQQFLITAFTEAAMLYEAAQGMVRIDVARDEMHAAFSVNVKRMPYFFKDREVTVGESGVRKRIFHIVRPHMRLRSGGYLRPVRMHFRGERDFTWNNYHVRVTVPGLHHLMLSEFNVEARDWDMIPEDERKKKMWSTGRAARSLRQHLDGKLWPMRGGDAA